MHEHRLARPDFGDEAVEHFRHRVRIECQLVGGREIAGVRQHPLAGARRSRRAGLVFPAVADHHHAGHEFGVHRKRAEIGVFAGFSGRGEGHRALLAAADHFREGDHLVAHRLGHVMVFKVSALGLHAKAEIDRFRPGVLEDHHVVAHRFDVDLADMLER
jgi:hypothetical protein